MKQPRATITDVAKMAGVSVGTVSHILSGKKGVSASRRERVMEAMSTLGYVPNVYAQGLRTAQSHIVGLCLPHANTSYLNMLGDELENDASKSGYSVLHIFSRQDTETELRRIKDMLRFRVDGMVLFPSSHPEPALDFLHSKKIPTVLIDRSNDDFRFDQITLDNGRAMREAGEHLIGLGHRDILFIYRSMQLSVTVERLAGLKLACSKAPEEVRITELEYGGDDNFMRDQVTARLAAPGRPTAIVVSNSYQAATLIGILRDLQISIPNDLSVVSFDDSDWSSLVSPPLATIRQPARSLVRTAWQLLLDRIANPDAPPQIMSTRAELVPRGSVGPAPRQ